MTKISSKFEQAGSALRAWGTRQWLVAFAAAIGTALLVGLATVLVPNGFFRRDISPEPWNYPIWLLTAVLTGLLFATYTRVPGQADAAAERPEGRFGWLGTVLAWFAVGCPVCNKLALLALGYTGAMTYFAPVQPFLAAAAVLLLGYALVQRLAGQVACQVTG